MDNCKDLKDDFKFLASVNSELIHNFFGGHKHSTRSHLLVIYPGVELVGQRVMDLGFEV